jgi:hypothetical protein
MLQLLLYIIPVFIVYLFIRASWVSNEALKTQYKLARLKDELTWLAIEGEINSENKEYAHLYSNIEKMMASLNSLNFWVMLYVLVKEKHQININEIEKIRIEVQKNKNFQAIYESYYKLLITYIARKNFLTVLLTFPLWKRMLTSRFSINEHDVTIKNNNTDNCIHTKEYSSFAFYINSISPKSLLVS